MSKKILYIVKSTVSTENVKEFNEWYHGKHIPEMMKLSGCSTATRYEALRAEDEFTFMAIYEFVDESTFCNYEASDAKRYLVNDFNQKFGDKARLKTSVWKQIYP